MSAYSIEVEGLCKNYKGFALKDVSFKLEKGTIMGFIGENGAGKTTTIKSIAGAVRKDAGVIKLFGSERDENNVDYKNDIGVVFDSCYFHGMLNVKSVGKMLSGMYSNWSNEKYDYLIKKLSLPADKKIKDFSSGMQMKLSIAAALSHAPKLLLLDEATSGLDPVVRNEILDLLLEYIQDEENSVLFSSHITSDLERVCDYITYIKNGRIVFSEDKNMIQSDFGIVRCGTEEIGKIPAEIIRGKHRNRFAYDVLIQKREQFAASGSGLLVESATLDDIMLYYEKE